MEKPNTKIPYDFHDERVKENFRNEAFKRKSSIVEMITVALQKNYPELFKPLANGSKKK